MSDETDQFQTCIIGAGVIGLALAYTLANNTKIDPKGIVLIAESSDFGQGISSRNSEVIHAGIYYPPNSLKAKFCVRGKALLYEYLIQNKLPFQRTGKLIVAQQHQMKELADLKHNAVLNGVDDLELLNEAQLRKIEPNVSAHAALYSPSTGIIDSHSYMHSLLSKAEQLGIVFAPNTRLKGVEHIQDRYVLNTNSINKDGQETDSYSFIAKQVINCGGLQASEIAKSIVGLNPDLIPKTHYCKGDYFTLSGSCPFNHLIYPLPEKNMTGLGVHSTVDLAGQVKFGPDSEYIKNINYQIDSNKIESFSEAIKRYFPALKEERLQPAYSGIRPKLSADGETPKDFCIQTTSDHGFKGLIQLFGIESPGLTSSLAIAEYVSSLLVSGAD